MFLYNTTSNIDEQGISELSLAAHLSNSIAVSSANDGSEGQQMKDEIISELAPKFIWLIRDFSLEKIHPETGEEISSKEYLELCLNKKSAGKNSNDNNIIRQNIVKYFHDRDCYTLPRPTDNEDDLKILDSLQFESLNSDFKLDFLALKQEVYKNSQCKRFRGKRLTGESLYELLKIFVVTINQGGIPNIVNAWETVILNDIKAHYDKSLKAFKEAESKKSIEFSSIDGAKPDFENKFNFESVVKELNKDKKESINMFMMVLYNNRDSFTLNKHYLHSFEESKLKLTEEIKKSTDKLFSKYSEVCSKSNQDIFRRECKDIEKKANERFYTEKNYLEYINDDETLCGTIKSSFIGESSLENFCNEHRALAAKALKSIEDNISIYYNSKQNESKKEADHLNFELDTENEKASNLNEKINSQVSRLKNKQSDRDLNQKEIQLLEDRIKDLKERLNIKKQSKDAKIRAEKERQKQEQEEHHLKQLEEEANTAEKDDLAKINKRIADQEKKKKSCGCGCLIF